MSMAAGLRVALAVWRREWASAFTSPLAGLFVAGFAACAIVFGFQFGGLFETGRADLQPFFQFHPWLHLVFMPALAMRSWAEEGRQGTLETLMGLPAPVWAITLGKFLALWTLASLALVLTVPLWVAWSFLGPVDHGATALTYLGSWLCAGAVLALGMAASALASHQVSAFLLGVAGAFVFTAAGLPLVTETVAGALGDGAGALVARASLLDRFDAVQRGALDITALIYFLSFIATGLAIASIAVDARRGDPR